MLSKIPFRQFSSSQAVNYIMLEYKYVEDAYYKRSKVPYLTKLVPFREKHQEALESLPDTKMISAPFQPFSGSLFFFETSCDKEAIEKFVKSDPYYTNNLIESYELKEFALTNKVKDFDRMSLDYLNRT